MADKSPRQSMSKKAGKTLKEKRAAKKDKGGGGSSGVETVGSKIPSAKKK